jgi:hypothetical protein
VMLETLMEISTISSKSNIVSDIFLWEIAHVI